MGNIREHSFNRQKSRKNEHSNDKRKDFNEKSDQFTTESSKNDRRQPKIMFDRKMSRKERKQEYIKIISKESKSTLGRKESRNSNKMKKIQTKSDKKNDIESEKKNENVPNQNKIDNSTILIINDGKISKETKSLINTLKLIFQPNCDVMSVNTSKKDKITFDHNVLSSIGRENKIFTFILLKETKHLKLLKFINMEQKTGVIFKVTNFENNSVDKRFNLPALYTFDGFLKDRKKFQKIKKQLAASSLPQSKFTSENKVIKERESKNEKYPPRYNWFENTFKNDFDKVEEIKRVVNFSFHPKEDINQDRTPLKLTDGEISLRHYETNFNESNENGIFKVGLKELGPKIDLKVYKVIDNVFEEW